MADIRLVDWCDFLDCSLSAVYDGDCPFEDRSCFTCPFNIDKEFSDE